MPDTHISSDLPVWDLSDLYSAPDSGALKQDLSDALNRAQAFETQYSGALNNLSGDGLAQAVVEFEAIDEILSRILSYSQLLHAGDVSDPEIGKFSQTMREKATEINSHLLFFTLELNKLDDEGFAIANPSSSNLFSSRVKNSRWLLISVAFSRIV